MKLTERLAAAERLLAQHEPVYAVRILHFGGGAPEVIRWTRCRCGQRVEARGTEPLRCGCGLVRDAEAPQVAAPARPAQRRNRGRWR